MKYLLIIPFLLFAGISEAALVSRWRCDELSWAGVAGEVIDTTGTNNGVAVGSATTAVGHEQRAGSFGGSADYVTVGTDNSLLFAITDNFTIMGWIKPTTNQGFIVNLRRRIYFLWYTNLEFAFRDSAGTASEYASATMAITLNKWTHVAVTRNNLVINFYLDGVLNAYQPTQVNDSGYASGTTSWINRGPNAELGTTGTIGLMDDIRIYNTALSTAEIQQIYFESSHTRLR